MTNLDWAITAAATAITERLAATTGIAPSRFPAPKVWAIKKDAEVAVTVAAPLIRAQMAEQIAQMFTKEGNAWRQRNDSTEQVEYDTAARMVRAWIAANGVSS